MGFARRLRNESEAWVGEGLISPQVREILMERYPVNSGGVWVGSLIASLSAIFMAAGVISLVAYNWELLPKVVRITLALLPLLVSQGSLVWWYLGSRGSPVVRDVIVILNGAALLLAMGLISQIYQIQGSAFWYLILCMGLFAPMVVFFQSLGGGLLFTFVLGISYFFGTWDEPWAPLSLALFILVPLLSWLRDKKGNGTSQSLWWTGVAGASLGLLLLAGDGLKGGLWLVNLGLLSSLLALAGLYETKNSRTLYIPSILFAVFSFGLMGFQATWEHLLPSEPQDLMNLLGTMNPGWIGWLGTALLMVVSGAVFSPLLFGRWSSLVLAGPVLGLFWGVAQVIPAQSHALGFSLASNLLVLLQGVVLLMDKDKHPSKVVGGSLLILGVINQRFFDGDFTLIVKGFVFVFSGVLFWLLYQVRYGSSKRRGV